MEELDHKKSLLTYLKNLSKTTTTKTQKETNEYDGIKAIIEFLHMDGADDCILQVAEKLTIDSEYDDFYEHFENLDSVLNLICLKETEPQRYYNVVHFENILINILASIMGLKYRIVLNPEDLLHPYYLTLTHK